jgi:hypothetical protein
MKLLITELFGKSDVEKMSDAYEVTLTVDGVEVMKGDSYHDKIYDKIEGFKEALKFLKKKFTVKEKTGNVDWD